MSINNPILETKDLSIGYHGKKNQDKIIFGNINLKATKAELVALLGANGIGKSTLLRNLVKLQNPLSGEIIIFDRNIQSFSRNEMARKVGYVSTEIIQVNNLKVYELVALGRYPHTGWMGGLGHKDSEKVEEAIEMVGLNNLRGKNINQLSDGERQRTMIARTLAQDTELIVLDEPTAFLDMPNKYETVHLLHRLAKEKNKTIIFSTHDLSIAIQEADKLWLMLDNSILQGAPEDLILKGSFGQLFEKSKLRFNSEKGEFRIARELSGNIFIEGPETELHWTKNALERSGLHVTSNSNSPVKVFVSTDQKIIKWILVMPSGKQEFFSIYDLALYLNKSGIGKTISPVNSHQDTSQG